jgi:glycosyltransferase involved in cell wall biosynthesis
VGGSLEALMPGSRSEQGAKAVLIIGTRERAAFLNRMLASVANDAALISKIVIVDQSDGFETESVAKAHASVLPVDYVRDAQRGLSRARNRGIARLIDADFEVIAFPDDDCRYQPDTLRKVLSHFSSDNSLDIVTSLSVNEFGTPTQGRWRKTPALLNRYNVWSCQTSYTTFYRKNIFRTVGQFNETLGVGAGTKWGAGEETEFMLRALNLGAKGLYDPSITVFHPEPLASIDERAIARGASYNRGFGRVLRLANFSRVFVLYMTLRPLVGSFASLLKGDLPRSHYRWIAARERFLGWCDAP